jgi:excisionase family DNA binding protein
MTMRNIREIAKLLNCSTDTVRRMLRENKVPGCKVRGVWKADPEKVVIALSNGYKPPGQR